MSKFLLFFSLILFFSSSMLAKAAQMPRFLGAEKKFRSYIYNPNDVYRYIGHYTYQGFVEFEEGEVVNTISMGDPTLWLFEHLGNRLFLKPIGEGSSETNMTVITNKKVYHFELMAKEAKGITDKDLIFVVKFAYPDEKDKNIVEFPKIPPSDKPDMRNLALYNFNYQYTGEPSIAPIKVFDNGEFTYFQFSVRNAEIPAVFTVDADGFESLVNFRAAGEYIIIERVSPQFTLRSGNDIVCVYNADLYINGRSKQSTLGVVGGKAPSNPYLSPNNSNAFAPNPAAISSPILPSNPPIAPAFVPQTSGSKNLAPTAGESNLEDYLKGSNSNTYGSESNPSLPEGGFPEFDDFGGDVKGSPPRNF